MGGKSYLMYFVLGSLSSPDVVSSVGAISVVDPAVQDPGVVDTPVGDPVAAGTVGADTNGIDVATNAPVVDQVVADTAVVDNPAVVGVTNPSPVVDPVVPDTVVVDAPVDETVLTPVVDAAVVDTAAIVEEIKPETQKTGMLNPTSNTDALTPVDPSNFYKTIYHNKNNFDIFLCSSTSKINILELE